MSNIANLAEAIGEPKIVVITSHIKRSLKAIRDFVVDHAPTKDTEAEMLADIDHLTFDEIMLAATLIATIQSACGSTGRLWMFITPLMAEGVGGLNEFNSDFSEWLRARSERHAQMKGKPVSARSRTKGKAGVTIAREA